jgi:hypothetical protein
LLQKDTDTFFKVIYGNNIYGFNFGSTADSIVFENAFNSALKELGPDILLPKSAIIDHVQPSSGNEERKQNPLARLAKRYGEEQVQEKEKKQQETMKKEVS